MSLQVRNECGSLESIVQDIPGSTHADTSPALEPFAANSGALPASRKAVCALGRRGEHTSELVTLHLHCGPSSLTQSADAENTVVSRVERKQVFIATLGSDLRELGQL